MRATKDRKEYKKSRKIHRGIKIAKIRKIMHKMMTKMM